MAKLIISLEGQIVREVELDKARMTIGRKPHNDIQIENLAVSAEHAAITTILNDSFLEDLDSTNGTLFNGSPIRKHVLQNGDEFEIGKFRLRYLNPKASRDAADLEKTMVMARPPVAPRMESADPGETQGYAPNLSPVAERPALEMAASPAPVGEPAPLAQGVIQVLTGSNAGKELDLTKSLTSLGKPGVQVAVIAKRPHGYFLTHVQGAVFPLINGQAVDAQPRQLHDHDIIELAGVKMEFFLK